MTEFPRNDLVRMVEFTPESRAALSETEGRTMVGYPVVFDQWAEIDSWEGTFRERFARGSFTKTISERGDKIKVLFNHGFDPQIGEKPLGRPTSIAENAVGVHVEVPLTDTDYNRNQIIPLLADGSLDGMSIRFSVVQETWAIGQDGIRERTITEAMLHEYGPVTFPAYEATQAGVRSASEFRSFQEKRAAATTDAPAADTSTGDKAESTVETDAPTELQLARTALMRKQLDMKRSTR